MEKGEIDMLSVMKKGEQVLKSVAVGATSIAMGVAVELVKEVIPEEFKPNNQIAQRTINLIVERRVSPEAEAENKRIVAVRSELSRLAHGPVAQGEQFLPPQIAQAQSPTAAIHAS